MNVIVSGMGAISLAGKGIEAHSQALFAEDPTKPIYHPNKERFDLKPPRLDFIPLTKEQAKFENLLGRPLNRSSIMSLQCFEECLQRAKLQIKDLQGKRVAFLMGTTAGATNTDAEFAIKFARSQEPNSEAHNNAVDENPAKILQSYAAIEGSEIYVINNACTSSADAIALGARFIEDGLFDYVFAGGGDEIVFQSFYGFSALQLVSPDYCCKPFDLERNGLLLSEGAAVLCLESTEAYQERCPLTHRVPEGHILGADSVTEAFHQTGPSPDALGLEDVFARLFTNGDFKEDDIDFISAHGTGTRNNDFSEGCFFKRHFPSTPIFASKGYTGHCLGAVGALEVVFSFLAMQKAKIPASYGFKEGDPEIGITPTRKVQKLPERDRYISLSTAVGFGGVNSALILGGSPR